jgi:hypothetical protein
MVIVSWKMGGLNNSLLVGGSVFELDLEKISCAFILEWTEQCEIEAMEDESSLAFRRYSGSGRAPTHGINTKSFKN